MTFHLGLVYEKLHTPWYHERLYPEWKPPLMFNVDGFRRRLGIAVLVGTGSRAVHAKHAEHAEHASCALRSAATLGLNAHHIALNDCPVTSLGAEDARYATTIVAM